MVCIPCKALYKCSAIYFVIVVGSAGQLTVTPQNAVGAAGDTFTLKADGTTANDIQWIYNSAIKTSTECVSNDATYTATDSAGDDTSCDLSATHSQDTSGIYAASVNTPSTYNYKAVVVTIGK